MSRLMRPDPVPAPYLEDIRVDRRTLQRGTLNDAKDQDGRTYLNADRTSYVYVENNALWFVAPGCAAVKVS
jgi:hypothetical protein